jgi:hypothetical protein
MFADDSLNAILVSGSGNSIEIPAKKSTHFTHSAPIHAFCTLIRASSVVTSARHQSVPFPDAARWFFDNLQLLTKKCAGYDDSMFSLPGWLRLEKNDFKHGSSAGFSYKVYVDRLGWRNNVRRRL